MAINSHILEAISAFADGIVVVPLGIILAVFFGFIGWQRGLRAWLVVFISSLIILVASKFLLFIVWQFIHLPIGLVSPSAHVAIGSLVYSVLPLVCLALRGSNRVYAAVLVSVFFTALFSIVRLKLGVHTRSEVIIGSMIGVLGTVSFFRMSGPVPRFNSLPLVASCGLVLLTMYGRIVYPEYWITYVAELVGFQIKSLITMLH